MSASKAVCKDLNRLSLKQAWNQSRLIAGLKLAAYVYALTVLASALASIARIIF